MSRARPNLTGDQFFLYGIKYDSSDCEDESYVRCRRPGEVGMMDKSGLIRAERESGVQGQIDFSYYFPPPKAYVYVYYNHVKKKEFHHKKYDSLAGALFKAREHLKKSDRVPVMIMNNLTREPVMTADEIFDAVCDAVGGDA